MESRYSNRGNSGARVGGAVGSSALRGESSSGSLPAWSVWCYLMSIRALPFERKGECQQGHLERGAFMVLLP